MSGRWDVVIAGGGPAGCAAAADLAARGRRVLLLERHAAPRPRLCGEFLSPDGVASAAAIGAHPARIPGAARLAGWSVDAPRSSVAGKLPGPALGVSRGTLDPWLRDVALERGAIVRCGVRVAEVRRALHGFAIDTSAGETFEARHVVDATGRGPGPVPDPRGARPDATVGLRRHFRGDADADRVRLFALGEAYVGIAPVDGGLVNVCLLARRAEGGRAPDPDALLERAASRCAALARVWRGLRPEGEPWTGAASMRWSRRSPVRDGVLHAGDAAAEVAPLLGEGMAMALESGRLAAAAIDAELCGGEAAATAYGRAWTRRFRGRLRAGRWLQRLLLSGAPAEIAVALAARVPAAADRIVAVTRSRALAAAAESALAADALTDPALAAAIPEGAAS